MHTRPNLILYVVLVREHILDHEVTHSRAQTNLIRNADTVKEDYAAVLGA